MAGKIAKGGPENQAEPTDRALKCGIVMPISAREELSEAHWLEVKSIIVSVAEEVGFEAEMVSTNEEVGLILKRIVQNLYDNPIVICDISAHNPNVMFELGIRLTFDRPTVIIKDDRTKYVFDTSPIEHIEYPRDLRYARILEFREVLKEKIVATYKAGLEADYSMLLHHLGPFKVPRLEKKEVGPDELIIDQLASIHSSIRRLEGRLAASDLAPTTSNSDIYNFDLRNVPRNLHAALRENVANLRGVASAKILQGLGGGTLRIKAAGDLFGSSTMIAIQDAIRTVSQGVSANREDNPTESLAARVLRETS